MIKGSVTALVTPFDGETVNYRKMRDLIEYQIENGTEGIVLLGTTGEAPTISEYETDAILSLGISVAGGKIPVIAGCGSNDTKKALKKCQRAQSLGADALLVLTPYYNKTNAEGMIRHFNEIADNVDIPIIIYNVPQRTGCNVDITAVSVLCKHKNIIGIKEASGNISYAADVAAFCSDDFFMMCGNDDIVVPMMALGAKGVISVASNIIPNQIHTMTDSFINGDINKALEVQLKYLPLIRALFNEVNPIPIKEAMNILGFNVGKCRLPLYDISENARKKLLDAMRLCGLCPGYEE